MHPNNVSTAHDCSPRRLLEGHNWTRQKGSCRAQRQIHAGILGACTSGLICALMFCSCTAACTSAFACQSLSCCRYGMSGQLAPNGTTEVTPPVPAPRPSAAASPPPSAPRSPARTQNPTPRKHSACKPGKCNGLATVKRYSGPYIPAKNVEVQVWVAGSRRSLARRLMPQPLLC